jgi:dTDP-4-amino-4,6-dideoxygalactose transaminase
MVPPDLRPDPLADAGMSWLSARLAATVAPTTVVSSRRRNWGALAVGLGRWKPVFKELPEGVCPLAFPIWVERRPKLIGMLRAKGIEPYVFGAFHHPLLDRTLSQDSRSTREEILCLPLHQELTDTDIERVCATMDSLREFASI